MGKWEDLFQHGLISQTSFLELHKLKLPPIRRISLQKEWEVYLCNEKLQKLKTVSVGKIVMKG